MSSFSKERSVPYVRKRKELLFQQTCSVVQGPVEQKERLLESNRPLLEQICLLASKIAGEPTNPQYATSPRLFVVGGFVRDALLGGTPSDADIHVSGVSPERLEQLVMECFPEQARMIGKAYEILRVDLDEGEMEISIRRHGKPEEAASFASGDPSLSVEDVARLSDFTINSVIADPLSGEVFDPFDGVEDLLAHRMRVVDYQTFLYNPNHAYRSAQFASRFHLEPDAQCLELCHMLVEGGSLEELAAPRIREEYRKLLTRSQYPSIGLDVLRRVGILDRFFPELYSLDKGIVEQLGLLSGEVWMENLVNVDRAAQMLASEISGLKDEERLILLLSSFGLQTAAIFRLKNDRISINEIDEFLRNFYSKFQFSPHTTVAAVVAVMRHLEIEEFAKVSLEKEAEVALPKKAASPKKVAGRRGKVPFVKTVPSGGVVFPRGKAVSPRVQRNKKLEQFLKELYPASWRTVLAVYELAIWDGALDRTNEKLSSPGESFRKLVEGFNYEDIARKTLLEKEDLVETLGLKRGPHIGLIIGEVEKKRLELVTKDRALSYVKDNLDELMMAN